MAYVSKEFPCSRVIPLGGVISIPQSRKRRFCIYTHHRQSDGSVFYVGKGVEKRPFVKSSRTTEWKAEASKGYFVCILIEGLTDVESLALEECLIEVCGLETLTNKVLGGSLGSAGYRHTEKHKAKLSVKMTGPGNPMFGRVPHNSGIPLPDERKEALRRPRPEIAGIHNPSADLSVYEFYSESGDTFIGNRADFRTASGLTTRDTTKLVTGARAKVKGWRLGDVKPKPITRKQI